MKHNLDVLASMKSSFGLELLQIDQQLLTLEISTNVLYCKINTIVDYNLCNDHRFHWIYLKLYFIFYFLAHACLVAV